MTTEAFAYLLADMELNAEKRAAVLAYVERQAAEIAALQEMYDALGLLYGDAEREFARLRAAAAVPREPTQNMIAAGYGVEFTDPDAFFEYPNPDAFYRAVWRAMYDAAPVAAPAPMTDAEVDAAINDTFPGDATITHTTWDWLRAIFRAGRAAPMSDASQLLDDLAEWDMFTGSGKVADADYWLRRINVVRAGRASK